MSLNIGVKGSGNISGGGNISIQSIPATITFLRVYAGRDINSSSEIAVTSGDAPADISTTIGSTITLPLQGNLSRTEQQATWQGGGWHWGSQTSVNFIGWTDGNAIYSPGSSYIVPSSNITMTGLWKSILILPVANVTAPLIAGQTVTIHGTTFSNIDNIAIQSEETFDYFPVDFTLINDTTLSLTVPSDLASGYATIIMDTGNDLVGFSEIQIQ